jgi:hypothetical protein
MRLTDRVIVARAPTKSYSNRRLADPWPMRPVSILNPVQRYLARWWIDCLAGSVHSLASLATTIVVEVAVVL